MKNERTNSAEKMTPVKQAWIFDVDGVLTSPKTKHIEESRIFNFLIQALQKGESVAINTGRSLSFINQEIVGPLKKRGASSLLSNLIGCVENGAVVETFDQEGSPKVQRDIHLTVPDEIRDEMRKKILADFSDTMFFDEEKLALATAEVKVGASLEHYWEDQKMLTQWIEPILETLGLADRFKVRSTRLGWDVYEKEAGKAMGIKKILEWTKEKRFTPETFLVFGDTISDLEMADEIWRQNRQVEFIFVGEREQLEGRSLPFPVVFTEKHCDSGTAEFLANF